MTSDPLESPNEAFERYLAQVERDAHASAEEPRPIPLWQQALAAIVGAVVLGAFGAAVWQIGRIWAWW